MWRREIAPAREALFVVLCQGAHPTRLGANGILTIDVDRLDGIGGSGQAKRPAKESAFCALQRSGGSGCCSHTDADRAFGRDRTVSIHDICPGIVKYFVGIPQKEPETS